MFTKCNIQIQCGGNRWLGDGNWEASVTWLQFALKCTRNGHKSNSNNNNNGLRCIWRWKMGKWGKRGNVGMETIPLLFRGPPVCCLVVCSDDLHLKQWQPFDTDPMTLFILIKPNIMDTACGVWIEWPIM